MASSAARQQPALQAITERREVDGKWTLESFPVLVDTASKAISPEDSVVAGCVYNMQCQCTGGSVKVCVYIKYEEGGFFTRDHVAMHMKLVRYQDWDTWQSGDDRWMGNFQVFVDLGGRTTLASPNPTLMFDFMKLMEYPSRHENGCHMFNVRDMHKHVDAQGKLSLRIKIIHCPCTGPVLPYLPVPVAEIPEKKEINGEPKRLAEYIAPPDFEIKVSLGGEKTFRCHKMVLTAKSPVLDALINGRDLEMPLIGFDVTDISAETMDHFLDFLYFERFYGTHASMVRSLPDLAEAADKYSVVELLEFCDFHLHLAANETNALAIRNLAGRFGLKRAEQKVGKLVEKNNNDVFENYDMDALDSDEDELWLPSDEADEMEEAHELDEMEEAHEVDEMEEVAE